MNKAILAIGLFVIVGCATAYQPPTAENKWNVGSGLAFCLLGKPDL